MKYLVLRQKDERSSDLCSRIERLASSRGGLEFPFRIDGYKYDEEVALRNVAEKNHSYHTGLFHENCRCHLIPVAETNSVSMDSFDDIDTQYMLHGSSRYTGMVDFAEEFDVDTNDSMYELLSSFYSNI